MTPGTLAVLAQGNQSIAFSILAGLEMSPSGPVNSRIGVGNGDDARGLTVDRGPTADGCEEGYAIVL